MRPRLVSPAVTVALLGVLCTPALAQAPASAVPDVLHRLAGAWVGEGTLLGGAGAFTMTWSAESAGAFRLDFTNGFVDDAGAVTPVLEAVAIYEARADGRLVARWTDSRPQEVDIVAEASDSVLVSEWTAPSETGRTEYRLLADGRARVRDWVRVEGELRLFGEATYRRR